MSQERLGRARLEPVTRGMDRLAALFSEHVRARATPYVGTGKVVFVESTDVLLLARVSGQETYVTAFRRSGNTVFYGCTCPFFKEGLIGCKHQWALVREASKSSFVRGADRCEAFEPNLDAPFREPRKDESHAEVTEDESLNAQLARSILMLGGRRT